MVNTSQFLPPPVGGKQQLNLPLTDNKEAERRERCLRLLSGDIGRVVRPASELLFDYDKATAIASHHVSGN